jgi:hypothetical protein
MRFVNYLNRYRRYLRPQARRWRPEKIENWLRLEQLDDRVVPSTLQVDFGFGGKVFGHYTASAGVNNNLTLSERVVGPFHQVVITDTAENVNVIGTAAGGFQGKGTHTVTTFLPLQSLFVDVLDGNDIVNVKGIDYTTTVRHIGAGLNTVNVGDGGTLLGIQGSLGVTDAGAGSSTHLNVDDSADPVSRNVLLFGGQINNLAPASIAYGLLNGSSTAAVTGGSGNDTYTVQGTGAVTTLNTGSGSNRVNVEATGAPLTVQGHGGNDQVFITSNPGGSGSLADVHGNVDVRNTTPSTDLIVDDSADPSLLPQTVSLSDTALIGLSPAPITYQPSGLKASQALLVIGREKAVPLAPLRDDTFIVTNTPGNTVLGLGLGTHQVNVVGVTVGLTTVDAFGKDLFTEMVVGNTAPPSPFPAHGGTLAGIHGLVDFGKSDAPYLVVDDSGDATPRTNVNLAASSAGGTITGLAPGATIQYAAVVATVIDLFGGSGGNTFNVADTLGATNLHGGNGGDTFNVANSTSNLNITTGSGSNHPNIQGNGPTASMNIDARAGQNTITIGSLAPALGGNLAHVRGGIFLDEANSSTALTVDDKTDPAFQNVILNQGVTANVIDFPNLGGVGAVIDFPKGGMKSVDVFGGKGGDRFTILNPPSTPVTLHGGSGIATLVGGNVPNLWTITGTNAGQVGSTSFTSVQNLVGGASTDTFRFGNGAGVTGFIDGGAGFNVLDYSAYTTPVSVNLGAHTATGVGGGVFNIQGVIGGSGGNTLFSGPSGALLIGGTGGNVLVGGSGRDVLIAGPGSSLLLAGSGEAILIGGTTLWDANVAALSAIMAEWGHTYNPINPLIDYQIRVGHLEHGGGLNGPFLLNPATVHSNSVKDTLVTNLGGGLDFVFFDAFDFPPNPHRFGEVYVPV